MPPLTWTDRTSERMIITKPAYYDRFRCIAGACPDSCCKEWDVQVDEDAAAYYLALPGGLGDRLRQVLRQEDGEYLMTIEDGRCPMWRQDGPTELCMSVFGRAYGTGISGQLFIDGKEVHLHDIPQAIKAGLAYITEDR